MKIWDSVYIFTSLILSHLLLIILVLSNSVPVSTYVTRFPRSLHESFNCLKFAAGILRLKNCCSNGLFDHNAQFLLFQSMFRLGFDLFNVIGDYLKINDQLTIKHLV